MQSALEAHGNTGTQEHRNTGLDLLIWFITLESALHIRRQSAKDVALSINTSLSWPTFSKRLETQALNASCYYLALSGSTLGPKLDSSNSDLGSQDAGVSALIERQTYTLDPSDDLNTGTREHGNTGTQAPPQHTAPDSEWR